MNRLKIGASALMLAASGFASAQAPYKVPATPDAGGWQYMWALTKGNVTVVVNPNRGGSIHSISVANVGDLLNDTEDGRGLGTSGIHTDAPPSPVWAECGCAAGAHPGDPSWHGNSYTSVTTGVDSSGNDYIQALNFVTKNWNSCDLGPLDGTGIQITHRVSFPSTYDGLIKVTVSFTNQSTTPFVSTDNDLGDPNNPIHFPIAPQLHTNDAVLPVDPNTGWSYRAADNQWYPLPNIRSDGGFLDGTLDFKLPSGHAIELIRPDTLGLALYAPNNDNGFYAKHITTANLNMVGSVWTIGTIPPGQTVSKTYYVVIGPKATIESVIGWVAQQGGI